MIEFSVAITVLGTLLSLMFGLVCWMAQRLISSVDALTSEVRTLDHRITRIETRLETLVEASR